MRARAPDAAQAMRELASAYWVPQLIRAVTALGVPDVLGRGKAHSGFVARRVGAHPTSLHRVMRALVPAGVLSQDKAGRFGLTRLGQTLRGDKSMRDYVLMIVSDWNWAAWAGLQKAVATGRNAFSHVHGQTLFQYLRKHPIEGRRFADAMEALSRRYDAEITVNYPFGRFSSLVDVGGAHGGLLFSILKRHPHVSGILFDQPQVVREAAAGGILASPAIAGRCVVKGGDFLVSVPAGADAYLLKHVVHALDDGDAVRLLSNCRRAMAPGGRILLVEHVLPRYRASWSALIDVQMMVGPGGKERSIDDFQRLLTRARLSLRRVVTTRSPLRVLEAAEAKAPETPSDPLTKKASK